MENGNGVKAMPGLFLAPNYGSFENKKTTGGRMGQNEVIFKSLFLNT